jgi:MFS family permease
MSFRGYSGAYLVLCGVALLAMFSTSLMFPMIPLFAREIGASGVVIGLTVAGYWVSRILMEIPSGLISQRFGYFRSMTVGLGLNVLGTFLSAMARDPFQFTLARALMGIGAPLFFAVATTFVLNLFAAERRGSAMGIFLLSMIPLVLLPHVREESKRMVVGSTLSLSDIREVIWNRNLLIVSSAVFAEFVMSIGILMTIFPLFAVESLGISLTDVGLLMGSRSVGFVIAMFTMGAISDRVGRKPVILFGLGSTAVLIATVGFVSSFWGIAAIIFVLGITTGAIWIVSPVLAAEAVEPDQRGAAIGTYRTAFDLGSIIGPIVMAWVFEAYGMVPCLYLASALLLANLVPAMRLGENKV